MKLAIDSARSIDPLLKDSLMALDVDLAPNARWLATDDGAARQRFSLSPKADWDVAAGDLLTLMYTSGTTGLPKGIEHTHFIRAMYATTMANAWRMAPESVVLHSGALVFNGAMVTMFPAFMCGATYVLHRAFDAEAFIDTVERERITHVMLVPAQIVAILDTLRAGESDDGVPIVAFDPSGRLVAGSAAAAR